MNNSHTASARKRLSDAAYNTRWMKRALGKVEQNHNGCWLWKGSLRENGYGSTNHRGRTILAHRAIYMLTYEVQLTAKQLVCHTCDVPSCVNPCHLWIGTNQENIRDASAKKRLPGQNLTHCKQGHAYTEENTYSRWVNGSRLRDCRLCRKIRVRRHHSKIKNEHQSGSRL